MAIGGDQGGSIRIPAAACGIVGLKPTFGLVPYTGIVSIEPTIDHTGPMAKTVYDTALLLEVLEFSRDIGRLKLQRDLLWSLGTGLQARMPQCQCSWQYAGDTTT